MGDVVEFFPGATRIRAELLSLRFLQVAMTRHTTLVTEDGLDVTDREAENLGSVIASIEIALGFKLTGKRD